MSSLSRTNFKLYQTDQMSAAKKNNARIQKWREMLTLGLHKDPELLLSRTRKGVPPSLRNVVWMKLIPLNKHIEQRQIDINYEKLTNTISKNVYEIGLDIPRTFPEEYESKVLRKSMNDVLKAIAITYPKIGYCQGMNFLTMRILEVLDNEETFWMLHYLFENDKNLRNSFIDPSSIQLHEFIFNNLLQQKTPHLYQHIKSKNIFIGSFTMKCFMTLYSNCLNQENFNQIFQIYLLEGWSIIYAIAVAMFKIHTKQLMSGTIQSIQQLLSRKIFEVEEIDQLVNEAFKLQIKKEKIKFLEKAYYKDIGIGSSRIEPRQSNRNSEIGKNRFSPQFEDIGRLEVQSQEKNFQTFHILQVLKNQIN